MNRTGIFRLLLALPVVASLALLFPDKTAAQAPGIEQVSPPYASYYGGACTELVHNFVIAGTDPNGTIINAASPNGLCGSRFIPLPENGSQTFILLGADDHATTGPISLGLCLPGGTAFCQNWLQTSTGAMSYVAGPTVSTTAGSSTYTLSNVFFYLISPRVGKYYPDLRSDDGNIKGLVVNFAVRFTVTVSTCPKINVKVSPTTASRSSTVSIAAILDNCTTSSHTLTLQFVATSPCSSKVMSTFPITVVPGQKQSVSLPFKIPEDACIGTYTLTLNYAGGALLGTSTAIITVTP